MGPPIAPRIIAARPTRNKAHEWCRDGIVRSIDGFFRLLSDGLSIRRSSFSPFLRRDPSSKPQMRRQGSRNLTDWEAPGSKARVRRWFFEVDRAGRMIPGVFRQASEQSG